MAASELNNLDIPDLSLHFCAFLESKTQKQSDKFGLLSSQFLWEPGDVTIRFG